MGEPLPDPITFEFKKVSELAVAFDLYLPSQPTSDTPLPVLIWWRGGGLTFGDKKTWFPTWLYKRATRAGWAFVSADYRLMPPGTSHDLLEDVMDLVKFIDTSLNNKLSGTGVRINPKRLAVGGMSAGAYAAYLAAAHARPRPKALLSIYGMGGNLIVPNYLAPKTSSFFFGTPLLDPVPFSMFMHPNSSKLPPLSSSPPVARGTNTPAALRMDLAQFYVQLGVKLDYMTGEHEPSLSALLRPKIPPATAPPSEAVKVIKATVPAQHHVLFPQLFVADFPPTFLAHGELDSVVSARESRDLHAVLQDESVETVLHVLEGIEHLWDFAEGAEERWKGLMDEAFASLVKHM